MTALYMILFVKVGIKCTILFRYKIFCSLISFISQTAPYNLLDLSVVNVYTRSKLH